MKKKPITNSQRNPQEPEYLEIINNKNVNQSLQIVLLVSPFRVTAAAVVWPMVRRHRRPHHGHWLGRGNIDGERCANVGGSGSGGEGK